MTTTTTSAKVTAQAIEKTYEALREKTIERLVYDLTSDFGYLAHDLGQQLARCDAFEEIFGEEEWGNIRQEVWSRIEKRGLKVWGRED